MKIALKHKIPGPVVQIHSFDAVNPDRRARLFFVRGADLPGLPRALPLGELAEQRDA